MIGTVTVTMTAVTVTTLTVTMTAVNRNAITTVLQGWRLGGAVRTPTVVTNSEPGAREPNCIVVYGVTNDQVLHFF